MPHITRAVTMHLIATMPLITVVATLHLIATMPHITLVATLHLSFSFFFTDYLDVSVSILYIVTL